MNNKFIGLFFIVFSTIYLTGCGQSDRESQPIETPALKEEIVANESSPTPEVEMYLGQKTDVEEKKRKLCGWVDESDIIIELSFAEGLTKDTSYETGFYFSPIMSTMRLARSGCDYRTGFSFEEMKGKGAVQVGVRGYSDNIRRQLESEPINVMFDAEGKPDVELPIKVKVLN